MREPPRLNSEPLQGVASTPTVIAFNPTVPDFLLTGWSDGSVTVHSLDYPCPVISWATFSNNSIVALSWLPSRPCVFFVLDCGSMIHVFDLSLSPSAPVLQEQLNSATHMTLAHLRG